MAAEHVFYGQNTTGVGGDVHSTTCSAARMVGSPAMAPTRVDLSDRIEDPELRAAEEQRVMERFEEIGNQIMHRSGGGVLGDDGLAGVQARQRQARASRRPDRPVLRVAYCTIKHEQGRRGDVADRLVAAGELYGDDVVELLDEASWCGRRSTCSTRTHGHDLIPPPSPAGRPEPESSESAGRIAENLWLGGEERRRR